MSETNFFGRGEEASLPLVLSPWVLPGRPGTPQRAPSPTSNQLPCHYVVPTSKETLSLLPGLFYIGFDGSHDEGPCKIVLDGISDERAEVTSDMWY